MVNVFQIILLLQTFISKNVVRNFAFFSFDLLETQGLKTRAEKSVLQLALHCVVHQASLKLSFFLYYDCATIFGFCTPAVSFSSDVCTAS